LTPEVIDAVLHDFRCWLEHAAEDSTQSETGAVGEAAPPEFSWYVLAAEFTALRQEVNLQTRAARAQLEKNAEALVQLENAARALDAARSDNDRPDATDELIRPLLKTLVDVYDALALASRAVERVEQKLTEDVRTKAHPVPSVRRWWPWRQPAESDGRDQQVLSSILVGYKMGLQRIERSLRQFDVEPIECVGKQFDPDYMEVVEAVSETGRQGTDVLEVVRRGYRWRGKLFRAAQVRVCRP
jgi:molecular chaperone GrpE